MTLGNSAFYYSIALSVHWSATVVSCTQKACGDSDRWALLMGIVWMLAELVKLFGD